MKKLLLVAMFGAFTLSPVSAQDRPVSAACKDDVAKYCAGKPHAGREARICLDENKSKLSDACKAAPDSTGGGRGQGKGKNTQ